MRLAERRTPGDPRIHERLQRRRPLLDLRRARDRMDPRTRAPNEALVRMVDGVGWEIRNMTHPRQPFVRRACVSWPRHPGWPPTGRSATACIHSDGAQPTARTTTTTSTSGRTPGRASRPGRGVIERNVIYGAPNGANIKLGAGEPDVARDAWRDDAQTTSWAAPHRTSSWPGKSHDNLIDRQRPVPAAQRDVVTAVVPEHPWRRPDRDGQPRAEQSVATAPHRSSNDVGLAGPIARPWKLDWVPRSSVPRHLSATCAPHAEALGTSAPSRTPGSPVPRGSRPPRSSQAASPTGADDVLIARADAYADALAGASSRRRTWTRRCC